MLNVRYDLESESGYACGTCGAPISPEELCEDKWHCGHDAHCQSAAVIVESKDYEGKAIDLITAERKHQMEKWGDQSGNHPFEWMSILGEEYGELCEAVNETCFDNATHPERGGAEMIIKEAVQVAAVAIAIIEAALRAKEFNDA